MKFLYQFIITLTIRQEHLQQQYWQLLKKIDIVDLAMDSMSGLTSQPALGSVVSIMKQNHADPKLDEEHIREASCTGSRCEVITRL